MATYSEREAELAAEVRRAQAVYDGVQDAYAEAADDYLAAMRAYEDHKQ